jgi:uncharacterized membrane protein YeaQ/YmgE (transglycosylase-associated protein family)
MGNIGWTLLGLFAGLIVGALISGQTGPRGCLATTAAGILGALLGGFIAGALEIGQIEDLLGLETWLVAIGSSTPLLLVFRALSRYGDPR